MVEFEFLFRTSDWVVIGWQLDGSEPPLVPAMPCRSSKRACGPSGANAVSMLPETDRISEKSRRKFNSSMAIQYAAYSWRVHFIECIARNRAPSATFSDSMCIEYPFSSRVTNSI